MEVIFGTHRVFLLSPANVVGRRAQILLNRTASFELARRLHGGGQVTLGEAFSFMSGLYFRGKMAYARAFAQPPPGRLGVYVITSNRGLLPVDTIITAEELAAFAGAPVDAQNCDYSEPLIRTALALANACPSDCSVILLGSIVSRKYTDHLLPIFGSNLHFPLEFVGRGDMSRGGLLLRSAAANEMLNHVPIAGASLRGERPPKLLPIKANRRTET
jgi:hypothetical protein